MGEGAVHADPAVLPERRCAGVSAVTRTRGSPSLPRCPALPAGRRAKRLDVRPRPRGLPGRHARRIGPARFRALVPRRLRHAVGGARRRLLARLRPGRGPDALLDRGRLHRQPVGGVRDFHRRGRDDAGWPRGRDALAAPLERDRGARVRRPPGVLGLRYQQRAGLGCRGARGAGADEGLDARRRPRRGRRPAAARPSHGA